MDSVYQGIPLSIFQRNELPEDADIDLPVVPQLSRLVQELLEQEQYDIAHVLHTMRMGSALEAIVSSGLPYIVTITDFFAQCFRINLVNVKKKLCNGANGGQTCAKHCNISSWTESQLVERSVTFRKVLSGAAERICPSVYVENKFSAEYPELSFRVIEHGIDLNMAVRQKEQFRKESEGSSQKPLKAPPAEGSLLAEGSSQKPLKAPPAEDSLLAEGSLSAEGSDNLVFGFVGSFVPEKGIECLIKAFRAVPAPNVRLRLYGGFFGADDYREKISELVSADKRISLQPFVETGRIFSVLMGFDVFCLPSIVPETFSLIVREAVAAGTPVLVSDLGAPADYVREHACGEVLGAGDAADWTRVFEQIIAKPDMLEHWKQKLPLPDRLEEEAFYYQGLYRKTILNAKNL